MGYIKFAVGVIQCWSSMAIAAVELMFMYTQEVNWTVVLKKNKQRNKEYHSWREKYSV